MSSEHILLVCPKYQAPRSGLLAGFVGVFSIDEIVMSANWVFDLLAFLKPFGLYSGSASAAPVLSTDTVM